MARVTAAGSLESFGLDTCGLGSKQIRREKRNRLDRGMLRGLPLGLYCGHRQELGRFSFRFIILKQFPKNLKKLQSEPKYLAKYRNNIFALNNIISDSSSPSKSYIRFKWRFARKMATYFSNTIVSIQSQRSLNVR